MNKYLSIGLGITACLLLMACDRSIKSEPTPVASTQLEVIDFEGNAVSLADAKGQVVVLNFWASWCAPCRQEMPLLDALYRDLKAEGLVLYAVNIEDDISEAKVLLQELSVSYPQWWDKNRTLKNTYSVDAMPTTLVFNREGELVHTNRGYRTGDEQKYREQVLALLKK